MKAKILLLVLMLFLVSCGPQPGPVAPPPDSDSGQSFKAGAVVPTYPEIYTLKGTVVGDVGSLTRQTSAARGTLSGYDGYISGSYFGAEHSGKGFIRLYLTSIQPSEGMENIATPENIVILKMTDTKGTMLLPGDYVTLKCRLQYEAVAATLQREAFDTNKYRTMELDYCRMSTPMVEVPK